MGSISLFGHFDYGLSTGWWWFIAFIAVLVGMLALQKWVDHE